MCLSLKCKVGADKEKVIDVAISKGRELKKESNHGSKKLKNPAK
jgi:hypothetical protein